MAEETKEPRISKEVTDKVIKKINKDKARVDKLYELTHSLFLFSKEVDVKIETLTDLLVEQGVLHQDRIEELSDKKHKVRAKKDDEEITRGDIVWVNYNAKLDGEVEAIQEVDLPIRVGSGAIAFETALIGKTANSCVTFKDEFRDKKYPQWVGKEVLFEIEIVKVKTNIEAVQ